MANSLHSKMDAISARLTPLKINRTL